MPRKLKLMRERVLKELNHVPKGGPVPQGELRAMYWMQRMHSLGKKSTTRESAKEILEKCITYLKKDYPDFKFKYDKEFFSH